MSNIRPAGPEDLCRIAEIEIFNYRLNFYPLSPSNWFYFQELQVTRRMEHYRSHLNQLWVYDDGIIKGFFHVRGDELLKLFVEPVFQSSGIGAKLFSHAVENQGARYLWALEKNERGIAFYQRQGFTLTGERKEEPGTPLFLVRLQK